MLEAEPLFTQVAVVTPTSVADPTAMSPGAHSNVITDHRFGRLL